MASRAICESTCVIRDTGKVQGRSRALTPQTGASKYLEYGRIVLDASDLPLSFSTGEQETGFICLRGGAQIHAGGSCFDLGPFDALYVPRDSDITVSPCAAGCDLVELSAPVDASYPIRFVSFAEVQRDPGLHFMTGQPSAERQVSILLGKNIEAGRIVAGLTVSKPGNWTSWPPHEHAELLEEAYLFVDMPAPAWGLQLVYTNPCSPELVTTVREGDCVMIPEGYHPNLAAPGAQLKFIWMMCAHRERVDRRFGVVNVQPEYASGPSGLERGK